MAIRGSRVSCAWCVVCSNYVASGAPGVPCAPPVPLYPCAPVPGPCARVALCRALGVAPSVSLSSSHHRRQALPWRLLLAEAVIDSDVLVYRLGYADFDAPVTHLSLARFARALTAVVLDRDSRAASDVLQALTRHDGRFLLFPGGPDPCDRPLRGFLAQACVAAGGECVIVGKGALQVVKEPHRRQGCPVNARRTDSDARGWGE
mmetsp:Transcript_2609/g.8741  ORF Transcript_2609/g.8741 Transcript_2609/m.8741 type:complete len:205 (-) Transcript_2609:83-697(-)